MPVHLVFVTKYRKRVLDGKAPEILRESFSGICEKFELKLREFNGKGDHVHLSVHYSTEVAVSSLTTQLERYLFLTIAKTLS